MFYMETEVDGGIWGEQASVLELVKAFLNAIATEARSTHCYPNGAMVITGRESGSWISFTGTVHGERLFLELLAQTYEAHPAEPATMIAKLITHYGHDVSGQNLQHMQGLNYAQLADLVRQVVFRQRDLSSVLRDPSLADLA